MEGDERGTLPDGRVQRGDVGVSDERLGVALPRLKVDAVENAHRAVSAANAPDPVNGFVGSESVQIGDAMCVYAGEVAVALEHVRADHRFPLEPVHRGHRALEIGFIA